MEELRNGLREKMKASHGGVNCGEGEANRSGPREKGIGERRKRRKGDGEWGRMDW